MNNNNGGDFGAFLAGFVIGGLVGAAAALVLAPQSGEETRSQLVQKGSDLRERAGAYGNEYREKAENYLHEARDKAQAAGSQVQSRVGIVLDEGKSKLASAKERVVETAKRVSDEVSSDEGASNMDA